MDEIQRVLASDGSTPLDFLHMAPQLAAVATAG
jgi:hypothetical protein